MPKIFEFGSAPTPNLAMQNATVGPVTPSAVINTYGAAVTLNSPRPGGGMIPLALQAVCAAALANITLQATATFSDGSQNTDLIWTPFTGALTVMAAGILVSNNGSKPEADPAASEASAFFLDTPVDLTLLFSNGLYLTQLAFACKSSGALDTASFIINYWGLYT